MFEATSFTRNKRRSELIARAVFLTMTMLMVLPLLLIAHSAPAWAEQNVDSGLMPLLDGRSHLRMPFYA